MKKKQDRGKHEKPRKKDGKHSRQSPVPENCFACDTGMHEACTKKDDCACYVQNPGAHT